MAGREHTYQTQLAWTGNDGEGTRSYRGYRRAHELRAEDRPVILASSDPLFRGDRGRWNPELLLVASLSSCHQLWYLHLASEAGVVVEAYEDAALGWMRESADGPGEFTRVLLRPQVTISAGDPDLARGLHHAAHEKCFIARSVNFPVDCEPSIAVAPGGGAG